MIKLNIITGNPVLRNFENVKLYPCCSATRMRVINRLTMRSRCSTMRLWRTYVKWKNQDNGQLNVWYLCTISWTLLTYFSNVFSGALFPGLTQKSNHTVDVGAGVSPCHSLFCELWQSGTPRLVTLWPGTCLVFGLQHWQKDKRLVWFLKISYTKY